MKLQRTTWILLFAACVMGTAVYFYEGVGSEQRQSADRAAKRLFAINKEDEITSVIVKTAQYTLNLQRTAPQPSSTASPTASAQPTPTVTSTATPNVTATQPSSWNIAVEAPSTQQAPAKPANDATVTFLVNLLVSGERLPLSPKDIFQNVLTIPVSEKANFGLDQPTATLDIQLQNGQKHQLLLGQPNFNRSAVYAQVDPAVTANTDAKSSDLKVVLVSTTFNEAVQRPLHEWFPAPAQSTATPTP